MLDGHEIDGGERMQPVEPVVAHQRGLPLVLVHAKPGLGVEIKINGYEIPLEILQRMQRLAAERSGPASIRLRDLRKQRATRLLHVPHPLMGRRKRSFRSGEERSGGAEFRRQTLESLDLGQ